MTTLERRYARIRMLNRRFPTDWRVVIAYMVATGLTRRMR